MPLLMDFRGGQGLSYLRGLMNQVSYSMALLRIMRSIFWEIVDGNVDSSSSPEILP